MDLSAVPDPPDDVEDFGPDRTSRQVFRETFSGFSEALAAIPLFLFSPILWLFDEVPGLPLLLVVWTGILVFKAWILMLIIGMLYNWSILPASLDYVHSLTLATMLYLLVMGINLKGSD